MSKFIAIKCVECNIGCLHITDTEKFEIRRVRMPCKYANNEDHKDKFKFLRNATSEEIEVMEVERL